MTRRGRGWWRVQAVLAVAVVFTVSAGSVGGVSPARAGEIAAVPGAPSGVSAVAGVLSAQVSWTPPPEGGSPVTGYQITVSPGGRVVDVPVAVTSWTVDGLAPAAPARFSVAAVNADGVGPASALSTEVSPTVPGGAFRALVPARVLDTRDGTGAPAAKLSGGKSLDVQITGEGGVPVAGVASVVLNVTIVGASSATHLTLWPTGETRPNASNLNVPDGSAAPNLVEVKVGGSGKVSVFNNAGAADVLFDVAGYVLSESATGATDEGLFQPLEPKRILDTREGLGAPQAKVGPGGVIEVQVTGRGGVPVVGVSAVVLNLTAVNASATTHITAWPTGEATPLASNLNVRAGDVRPNRVTVKVGANGKVSLRNNSGAIDLIADVGGWFTDGSDADQGGAYFTGVSPTRVFDSRDGTGGPVAKLVAGTPRTVQIAGKAGVPDTEAAIPATAVVANVTVVGSSAPSHLTIWPSGTTKPDSSDLNFQVGQVVANLTVVKLGADGSLQIATNSGQVDVIVDVMGYYTGDIITASNLEILDGADASKVVAVGPDTVTFSTLPAGIDLGDLIVSGGTAAAPVGFLRWVLAVDGVVVTTAEADLSDAIIAGSLTAGASPPGAPGAGRELGRRAPQFTVGDTITNTFSETVSAGSGTGGSIAVQGSFTMGLAAHLDMDFDCCVHVTGDVGIEASQSFSASVTGTLTSSISWKKRIFEKTGAPIDVQIGPVPVLVLPVYFAELALSGSATGSVAGTVNQSKEVSAGIRFHDTEVDPYFTSTEQPITFTGPDVSATAAVKASVDAGVHFLLYDVTGPRVAASVYARINATVCRATLGFGVDLTMAWAFNQKFIGPLTKRLAFVNDSLSGLSVRRPLLPEKPLKEKISDACKWKGSITVTHSESQVGYVDQYGQSTSYGPQDWSWTISSDTDVFGDSAIAELHSYSDRTSSTNTIGGCDTTHVISITPASYLTYIALNLGPSVKSGPGGSISFTPELPIANAYLTSTGKCPGSNYEKASPAWAYSMDDGNGRVTLPIDQTGTQSAGTILRDGERAVVCGNPCVTAPVHEAITWNLRLE